MATGEHGDPGADGNRTLENQVGQAAAGVRRDDQIVRSERDLVDAGLAKLDPFSQPRPSLAQRRRQFGRACRKVEINRQGRAGSR
jgi:hypothetical protein